MRRTTPVWSSSFPEIGIFACHGPGESGPDRRGRVFDDPVIPTHVGRQGDAFHPASAAEVTPRTDQGPADSVPVRARPGPPRSSRPSRLPQPKRAVWCARGAPSSPAAPARPLTRSARSDRSQVCGPGGRAAWSVARRSIRECGDAREIRWRSLRIDQCRAGGHQRRQVGGLEQFARHGRDHPGPESPSRGG
jgi:hypothetical protein